MFSIIIATARSDCHAHQLAAACRAANVASVALRLSRCQFDTTRAHGLTIPGFDETLPDAVLVRSVGGGSYEEVIRRLGVLSAWEKMGVLVWNDSDAARR